MPEDYYPIGITSAVSDGATFLIATPEKALCDTNPPLQFSTEQRRELDFWSTDYFLQLADMIKFE